MDKISFVIPCYQSELTLEQVVIEIKQEMERIGKYAYEIVLVNDSSRDNTLGVIRKLCAEAENVVGISLARNFGQHAALLAGFRHVTGDIIICLDDDGQTPPSAAGALIQAIEDGRDVAYAKYISKKHSIFRNLGSKANDIMTRHMLGKPKNLYISSYFAAKRFIIDDVIRYESSYPYVIGLVLRTTKNICNVEVNHRERELGNSGYTIGKLVALWLNGFTAFSIKPLRFATIVGASCAALGFLYGLFIIIRKFILPDVPLGFSSLMSVLVFIGGMIMLMLGLIGEYVGRIYISMNNSPQYVVKEVIGTEYKGTRE